MNALMLHKHLRYQDYVQHLEPPPTIIACLVMDSDLTALISHLSLSTAGHRTMGGYDIILMVKTILSFVFF